MLTVPFVNVGSATAIGNQNVGGLFCLRKHTVVASLQDLEAFLVIRGDDNGFHGVKGSKVSRVDEPMRQR